ncbi:MAG: lipoyl synthase [Thiohalophilus sp.]|uniref:lipoyl synthase n=1 Tax=Thiohalophilus sp. TaxID=3028392 RepID=UPI00286FC719|nr:lipoyl synthase [Thiohalophilus sp.]MDR9436258.1 lipoyl synthase [Thiohalophilus sp.]
MSQPSDTNSQDTPPRPANPLKGKSKTDRIPIKVVPADKPLPKPRWIRARSPNSPEVGRLKQLLREHNLYTVCEEAACPNLGECFAHGTATFMIMGEVCTRRCPFCDVAHGRPDPLDEQEPHNLAVTIGAMQLRYVVITSVDRDDLRDGGGAHFARCIEAVRQQSPGTRIEILVPDFRGRMDRALNELAVALPDVFNHNLETVPRLYKQARPGADYAWSLKLLQQFKQQHPGVPTKSGLMLGLGENLEEVQQVMQDLREHDCDMLTLGQYLQPGPHHLPVSRYVTPEEFKQLETLGYEMGFSNVASGPMVRSSYHADKQAAGEAIT